MKVGRFGTVFASVLALAFAAGLQASFADEWRTTSSLIGESKYGDNFQHYDYVNPDAPKGGTINSVQLGTFDSFNPYIVQGSPAAGLAPFGGGLLSASDSAAASCSAAAASCCAWACSATSLGSRSGSGSRGAIGSVPRTTTTLVSTDSRTVACSGLVAAGPLKTPLTNHRGPSNPTKRRSCSVT